MRNLNLNLNSAQFFYLAPKFPQHLKFDKNMHIHFPYKVKRWPINQGMDEHNEKRVWELLVESAESHSAQFFYLAPKFPQHLKFDKNMHIHFPYNGQFDLKSVGNKIGVDNVI